MPGEPAHVAAVKELAEIDRVVQALAPADDPRPAAARIDKLAKTRCFGLLGGVHVGAETGLSLRAYWLSGGHDRLEAALALGGKGRRLLWTEPSIRRALTLETAPASPIAAMLCPASDDACGAETAGWVLRANAVFARGRKDTDRGSSDCEARARAAPRRRQFEVFTACFEASQDTPEVSLPIGRTRAPARGWLLVRGRRGHYDFCDEIRAYDLATGSAYVVGSCSALALRADGSADGKATDAARRSTVTIGHVALLYLREAVWMTLLLDELDRNVRTDGIGIEVPSWIDVGIPENDGRGVTLFGSASVRSSTDQSQLDWEIVGAERLSKSGTLVYPYDGGDVAADHAVQLLQIAESSLVAGCPAAPPPSSVVDRIPAKWTGLRALWATALAAQAACRPRR